MYPDDRLQRIAEEVRRDQAQADPARANKAARSIGIAVWAFAHNADYDGEKFVERTQPADALDVVAKSRALARALATATKLMDNLRLLRIDGHDAAVPALARARFNDVMFGGAAEPFDVHEIRKGHRIAGRALELLYEREKVIEHYAWPRRVREMARGVDGVPPDVFVSKVLDDLAHDLEVASAFYEAIADIHENKHGGQTSPSPLLLAACALAWFDGTDRLPSAHKPSEGKNAASRPDLFGLVEELHGKPLPRGLSRETFGDVVATLSNEAARETFRYQFRLQMPNRKNPHEY